MDKDPYLSNWENTVEAAREQENKELSIEYNYPPDKKEKAMNRERVMPANQQVAIIKAYSQVSLFAKWGGRSTGGAIEAQKAMEEAFPWLLEDSEDYMKEDE
jgi:hypothetical protein